MKGKKEKSTRHETIASAGVSVGAAKRAAHSNRSCGRILSQDTQEQTDFSRVISDTRNTPGQSSYTEESPVAAPVLIDGAETTERSLGENWIARNGHSVTYVGIFLFTLVLYFRPYELIPALSGFNSIAMIFAIATLIVFVPSQVTTDGTLTAMTTEVKCVLFITAWALISIPLAKSPGLAWETFNDTFIKVMLMFIIMANTVSSKLRLKGLMWLGIGVGIMLSLEALDLYANGQFKTEGYRVSIDFGGMFGNPNDMSIHLVIFIPLAIALGGGVTK